MFRFIQFIPQIKNRYFSVTKNYAVTYENYGSPLDVLKIKELELPKLKKSDVLLKILAAPINPSDINMIEGRYPIRPTSKIKVGGNECIGVIRSVGEDVKSLKRDSIAIPKHSGLGTWRNYAIFDEKDVISIPDVIPLEYASIISVNPSTAYRLLKDFVELKKDDVIIQNASSSMVGQAVIAFAKNMGVITVNIIRESIFSSKQKEYLKSIGADIVITDEELKSQGLHHLVSNIDKPKLALNAVGGESARNLCNVLDKNGVLVTYGGMSKQPMKISVSPFIFKNITFKGFWMTRWYETHSLKDRKDMWLTIINYIKRSIYTPSVDMHRFIDFDFAFKESMKPHRMSKVVIVF